MFNHPDPEVDVVSILLHPAYLHKNEDKREEIDEECTYAPSTLKHRNDRLLANNEKYFSLTGDHNQDLYIKSKEHEKRNRDPEEYWYERQQDECLFTPQINKK